MKNESEKVQYSSAESSEEGKLIARAVVQGFPTGKAPVKIVTGTQTTSGLNFDLKPGSIVAHPGATVIFVCG
jgi:hypothetical protein